MNNPISTYRIQFHKDFSFDDFQHQLPYLQKLGVSTIYASPIFEASPGSVHGYDGVNPHKINPEIGTKEQLREFSKRLQEQGIGWLQDIVPNHMAFHQNNEWLMDLLEKGPQSKYASFFDVAWNSDLYKGRLMVPFLGSSLEDVIKNGELKVGFENHRLVLKYFDSSYPLQAKSYATILQVAPNPPKAIEQLLQQKPTTEDERMHTEQWNELRLQVGSMMKNDMMKEYFEKCFEVINNNPEQLQQLCDEQSYKLCHWEKTDFRINYRRFFTVNGLICLNIQTKEVFEEYHKVIKTLVDDGVFKGLRIDHIDGLFDPTGYLEQLRDLVGDETYITVEKILEPGEGMPTQWPIQGNTGYDFLSMVNNLLTNKSSEQAFTDYYTRITGDDKSIHQQLHDKKSHILYTYMAGELENLYRLFMKDLVQKEDYAQMRTEDIKTAIAEFLIQCPVYRYYGNAMPLLENEVAEVNDIFNRIKKSRPDLTAAVDLLENVLIKKPLERNEEFNAIALRFYQRCMQFTGPLMAKGVEDTLMYTYNRFIGHNEVGDSPEAFGCTTDEFHQMMKDRLEQWPLSINATSTHDTKRGEDVRARLNVLTDLPEEWLSIVEEWRKMNTDLKKNGAPDANEEYLIYQTLVGAYSMPGQDDDDIKNRLEEFIEKALREAKVHSNWATPDVEYETAVKNFTTSLLDESRPFWKSFHEFQEKIASYGMANSLAQVLLKLTCPGVPDVYQGTELWDLSLVDPDNRRYVDYERRQQYLDAIEACTPEQQPAVCAQLWYDRYTAEIKQWLIHKLLIERKENPTLFEKGEYIPLQAEGAYKDHVFAFARKYENDWFITAVPLHIAQLCKEQNKDILEVDWKDTRVVLPSEAPHDFKDVLLQSKGKHQSKFDAQQLFQHLPFAVLQLHGKAHSRNAGLLLHITSLPSPFGIGDLGHEAFAFADFLERTNQTYWQLLPINPTEQGQGHSPYSSLSSKAGNTLLISPERLADDGLLDFEKLKKFHLSNNSLVDFKEAENVKKELFETAWQAFKEGEFADLKQQFKEFCQKEESWLNDFSLFMLLKQENEGQPWYRWSNEYKLREPGALETFYNNNSDTLEKVKWLQFIFSKQYIELRHYCNSRNIKLYGDMPFYVSYDSADVWSDHEIFALDEEGNMTGVAGVPPDCFSEDGQLWGMPVFKWDVLKERNYDWWIQRFKKNIELFDIVRLDHFRAFADYWEVPANETTAKNGKWKPGPGAGLFEIALKELRSLPFIAEDLGEINEPVYELRDRFNLPGMKVLQFAFGDDIDVSPHSPHNFTENFFVYTGTHDNNTTLGWYRHDGRDNHKRIEHYVGTKLTENEAVHAIIRLAYTSVAKTAIIPMQDLLALNETARMNTPSTTKNNWAWRLKPKQLTTKTEEQLKDWTKTYNRK